MSSVKNLGQSSVAFVRTDIPSALASQANLFSQTGQFLLEKDNFKALVYLPFAGGGGPLYFDYLVFVSAGDANFEFFGSIDNLFHQGSSGHDQLVNASSKFVIVADSGKEWTGQDTEKLWSSLGYDYMREPPQDYAKWPLGYLVQLTLSEAAPYVVQTRLTDFRSFNHSVAIGDINADGIKDYLASGVSNAAVDLSYWTRIGYLSKGLTTDVSAPIWINSPNLEAGNTKFGMAGVSLSDVTGDGKDEGIFSGGSFNATPSDKVIVVYQFINDRPVEYSSVQGYGKFIGNPGYNHYMIDFDRDGDKDLLVYFGVGSIGFEVLENTGSGVFRAINGNLGLDKLEMFDFKHVQIIDFNSDGYEDIVLDNLSYDFNLNLYPERLNKALIQNNDGKSFTFSEAVIQSTGPTLSADYRAIASSFAGYVGDKSFQYVTSYVDSSFTKFGVFTQNISFDQLPNLILGTDLADILTGSTSRDVLKGYSGNDSITGHGGVDKAVFEGKVSEYQVEKIEAGSFRVSDTISSRDGTDFLVEVERLQFSNRFLALDLDGNAGKVAKILGAIFGQSAVSNKTYVGIGLGYLDSGMSYDALAGLAVSVTGRSSSTDICNLLWTNVVKTTPTEADIAPFKAMLDSGQMSIGSLAALAADTSFNTTNIDLVGLSQTGLEYV